MLKRFLGLGVALFMLIGISYWVHRLSGKRTTLKAAYLQLSQNFVISEEIRERSERVEHAFLRSGSNPPPPFNLIIKRSLDILHIVDTIQTQYVPFDKRGVKLESVTASEASTYFQQRVSIGSDLRQQLPLAVKQYREKIESYFEKEVSPKREHYQRVLEQETEQLNQIEKRVLQRNQLLFRETFFIHLVPDTVMARSLDGRITARGIEWDTPLYKDYTAVLRRKINAFQAMQLLNDLNKLGETFLTDEKLNIYGKTYDLTNLTACELSTVCTYLNLQVLKIDEVLINLNSEVVMLL